MTPSDTGRASWVADHRDQAGASPASHIVSVDLRTYVRI
jgi:hypothetical protein